MVDVRHLSDFLELARTGNFSSAALARNISQPAFSRRIQQLEEWVGALLLDRSSSPARLTRRGKEFTQIAADTVSALERFRRQVRLDNLQTNPMRVISLYSLTSTFLPGWLGTACSSQLLPAFQISFGSYGHCFEGLRQRTADVALLYFTEAVPDLRFRGLSRLTVATERFVPVMSGEYARMIDAWRHGGSTGQGPAVIELRRDIYLGKALAGVVDQTKKRLECSTTVGAPRLDLIRGLVEAGYGIGWLPLSLVREALDTGRLRTVGDDDAEVELQIVLVAASEQQLSMFEDLRKRTGGEHVDHVTFRKDVAVPAAT